MKFANLFERDEKQVLIMIDSGDKGPEVAVYFEPEGLGVCCVTAKFSDSDDGWAAAQARFDSFDEEKAFATVDELVEKITGEFPADAGVTAES